MPSNCGAGKKGSAGFQPGNTCAGEGGSQTSTPEFKSWFGDSKVVNDNGEPLVVYHGTSIGGAKRNKDTAKNIEEQGFIPQQGDWGKGIYFTDNPDVASLYADEKGKPTWEDEQEVQGQGSTIYPSYVKIEKPFTISETSFSNLTDILFSIPTDLENWDETYEKNKEKIGMVEGNESWEIAQKNFREVKKYQTRAIINSLKEYGYDGLKIEDANVRGKESTYYVAWNPTQIKSSISNKGTFDPDNPKITHSKSDCGAGKDNAPGFQPGNTCAGEGGGEQTSTPEFKSWFGDSKIVNESGEPLVVYHGSGVSGIETFDSSLAGTVQRSDWGEGIYFTPKKWQADSYRDDAVLKNDPVGDKLYKEAEDKAKELGVRDGDLMYVGIDLGFDTPEYNEVNELTNKWREHREELTKSGKEGETYSTYLKIKNPLIYQYVGITDPTLAEEAKHKGHDGIIIVNEDRWWEKGHLSKFIDEIIVFDSTQIKSATGNKGDFDPDNPKITYAKSDCGAGKEGSAGFQPGNTCAGESKNNQTTSKEFKSWFGDSKIVDKNGEPMVVYHGSPNPDFNELSYEHIGKGLDQWGLGFYMGETAEIANRYTSKHNVSGQEKKHGGVLPLYAKIKNPLVLDGLKDKNFGSALELTYDQALHIIKQSPNIHRKIYNPLEDWGYDVSGGVEDWMLKEVADSYTNPMQIWNDFFKRQNIEGKHAEIYLNALSETTGYDGVQVDFGTGKSFYIAWFPNQVKSAIGNKGTFDPDNLKLTHKKEFARDKDIQEEFDSMFEDFNIDLDFESAPNKRALADLEARVPMLRMQIDEMERTANNMAMEIVSTERLKIIPYLEKTSNAMKSALRNAFWVSDVDYETVVNLQKLLADAIRGVMPGKELNLPDFIDHAKLEGASNLTDARLETIYRTNIMTSANEGVMSVLRSDEGQDAFPLVMIDEISDDRTRPHHKIMDGYITTPSEMDRLNLRPPNGYNCRATLVKIDWDEANDLGLLDDLGKPDMIAINRYNTPEQQGLIKAGIYPDEGFKRGNFI